MRPACIAQQSHGRYSNFVLYAVHILTYHKSNILIPDSVQREYTLTDSKCIWDYAGLLLMVTSLISRSSTSELPAFDRLLINTRVLLQAISLAERLQVESSSDATATSASSIKEILINFSVVAYSSHPST